MAVEVHAPMQDARDLDAAVYLAVEDHMGPLGVLAIARPDVVAGAPKGRELSQRAEATVRQASRCGRPQAPWV
jgi:hypothetical protein